MKQLTELNRPYKFMSTCMLFSIIKSNKLQIQRDKMTNLLYSYLYVDAENLTIWSIDSTIMYLGE